MNQYSTNKLCQLCGVSRKQLRYYEERGILSNVPRSDSNNYRYYTQEHIYEIVAAKGLKNIDMSLAEMKDVIYGKNVDSIQLSLQKQLNLARENLEESLRQYEQSTVVYAKLAEALSVLKLHHRQMDSEFSCEVVDRPAQDVVSLPYTATFEDEGCCDVEHLPRIQTIAQEVNAISFGSLLYLMTILTALHARSTTRSMTSKLPFLCWTGKNPATITIKSLPFGVSQPFTSAVPKRNVCTTPI